MVQATLANVIYPNKSAQEVSKMHKGHLIESETYIGGHVESLAAGLFRSDIPMQFNLVCYKRQKKNNLQGVDFFVFRMFQL